MEPQSESESRPHFVMVDRKFWADNPDYFFASLSPWISRYAQRADDASIQNQIDIVGRDHIGKMPGCLACAGNFAAVNYADTLPDRIAILAYLTEIMSFYDGIVF
jgi:hypothetical protein